MAHESPFGPGQSAAFEKFWRELHDENDRNCPIAVAVRKVLHMRPNHINTHDFRRAVLSWMYQKLRRNFERAIEQGASPEQWRSRIESWNTYLKAVAFSSALTEVRYLVEGLRWKERPELLPLKETQAKGYLAHNPANVVLDFLDCHDPAMSQELGNHFDNCRDCSNMLHKFIDAETKFEEAALSGGLTPELVDFIDLLERRDKKIKWLNISVNLTVDLVTAVRDGALGSGWSADVREGTIDHWLKSKARMDESLRVLRGSTVCSWCERQDHDARQHRKEIAAEREMDTERYRRYKQSQHEPRGRIQGHRHAFEPLARASHVNPIYAKEILDFVDKHHLVIEAWRAL